MADISLSDNFLSAIEGDFSSLVSKLRARLRYSAAIPFNQIGMEPTSADLHKLITVLQEKNSSFEHYLNNNENFNIGTLNLNLRFIAARIKESEGLLEQVDKSTNPHTVHEYDQFILGLKNYLSALNKRVETLIEENKDKEKSPQAKKELEKIWISPYLLSAINLKLKGKDKINVADQKLAEFRSVVRDLTIKQTVLKGLIPEMFESNAVSSTNSDGAGNNRNSFLAKSRSRTTVTNNNNVTGINSSSGNNKRSTFN